MPDPITSLLTENTILYLLLISIFFTGTVRLAIHMNSCFVRHILNLSSFDPTDGCTNSRSPKCRSTLITIFIRVSLFREGVHKSSIYIWEREKGSTYTKLHETGKNYNLNLITSRQIRFLVRSRELGKFPFIRKRYRLCSKVKYNPVIECSHSQR
jgi:hypothetical protein